MQTEKPFEHLIINGSATDNIRNYLEQNKQPHYRKWISEPDYGIADAFNKGILNSTGNILVMLNAGDAFFDPGVIKTVTQKFKADPHLQWLHGKYKIFRGNNWEIIGKVFEKEKLYRGMRSLCHQSMFIKRELHNKYGLYFVNQKFAMDYDFVCRISGESFTFLTEPLVIFAPAGISSANYFLSLKQMKIIYEKYFGRSVLLGLWQARLKLLYYILQSPAGNFLYKIKRILS